MVKRSREIISRIVSTLKTINWSDGQVKWLEIDDLLQWFLTKWKLTGGQIWFMLPHGKKEKQHFTHGRCARTYEQWNVPQHSVECNPIDTEYTRCKSEIWHEHKCGRRGRRDVQRGKVSTSSVATSAGTPSFLQSRLKHFPSCLDTRSLLSSRGMLHTKSIWLYARLQMIANVTQSLLDDK